MDRSFVIEWIAALRSGRYEQHRHRANNFSGMHRPITQRCCINVGAHVKMGAAADSFTTADSGYHIGMSSSTDLYNKLITMNDTERKSFIEIADYLESEVLPGLK